MKHKRYHSHKSNRQSTDNCNVLFKTKTLVVIVLALIGFIGRSVDKTLDEHSKRLRTLEQNQKQILTLLGAPPQSISDEAGQPQEHFLSSSGVEHTP